MLTRTLADGTLSSSSEPATVGSSEYVVVVVGTPVDEHLNPDPQAVVAALEGVADQLRDGQVLILRSTVFPGRHPHGRAPDRTARAGRSTSPSVPSGSPRARRWRSSARFPRSSPPAPRPPTGGGRALFGHLTETIVRVEPEEAELAKLFTNSYRYIKFAAANQLFMMANDFGLDYERIRGAVSRGLPAGGRSSRTGVRGGPVPPQGHDAARGVQQQQLRARVRRACRSTRGCRCTWCRGWHPLRPRRHDGRDPRHGVQRRIRRQPLEPGLQVEAGAQGAGQGGPHARIRS